VTRAVQIICHARLTNPNEIELPLVETRYTVALDDERVYQGRHAIARTLMPAADIMVEIPAVVPRADVETLSGLETMLRIRGKLDYITPGAFAEAMFDIGVRRPSVAYAWDRRVQFDDDAGRHVSGLRVAIRSGRVETLADECPRLGIGIEDVVQFTDRAGRDR
jgi:hypothetical protein